MLNGSVAVVVRRSWQKHSGRESFSHVCFALLFVVTFNKGIQYFLHQSFTTRVLSHVFIFSVSLCFLFLSPGQMRVSRPCRPLWHQCDTIQVPVSAREPHRREQCKKTQTLTSQITTTSQLKTVVFYKGSNLKLLEFYVGKSQIFR